VAVGTGDRRLDARGAGADAVDGVPALATDIGQGATEMA
jgi:hypothetical protein